MDSWFCVEPFGFCLRASTVAVLQCQLWTLSQSCQGPGLSCNGLLDFVRISLVHWNWLICSNAVLCIAVLMFSSLVSFEVLNGCLVCMFQGLRKKRKVAKQWRRRLLANIFFYEIVFGICYLINVCFRVTTMTKCTQMWQGPRGMNVNSFVFFSHWAAVMERHTHTHTNLAGAAWWG